jgi:hypothetical protein
VPDRDAEPFVIDLSSLPHDERAGLLLLLEVERMAAQVVGQTVTIGAPDADKARELLGIITDAPTPVDRPKLDPLMADAPVPLPPGSHAFDHGFVLQPRHRSAITAVALAAALAALGWLAARDRRASARRAR